MKMVDGMPRRIRTDLASPAESAIREAMRQVELAGAHPRLTDAVILLQQALDATADFVDLSEPPAPTAPRERPMSALDQQVAEMREEVEYRVASWLYEECAGVQAECRVIAKEKVDALLTTHRRQVLTEIEEKLRTETPELENPNFTSGVHRGMQMAADFVASLRDIKEG